MTESRTWEDINFRERVLELTNDDRFEGIFGFLSDIRFCWSYTIPTACAGYGYIFFNPDWYDTLPEETQKTVIYHEAMHLIWRHLQRGADLEPYIHNIACDHVINLDAENHGFTFENWKAYKDPIYSGKTSEEVYDIMMDGNKYDPIKIDFDQHIDRSHIEDLIKEMGELEDKSLDEIIFDSEVKVKTFGDASIGTGEGQIGLDFRLMTKRVAIEGATWEQIFEKHLTAGKDQRKRTYKRPSRRVAASKTQPFVLPGRLNRKGGKGRLKHMVYLLDVSGSITSKQSEQFNDSAQTIKKLLNPEAMTVMFFDTSIRLTRTFTDTQPYSRMKVRAGGGTDLRPVYKKLEQIKPESVVIFTDLCVDIPPEPEWDTTWLLTSKNDSVPDDLYGDIYIMPKE